MTDRHAERLATLDRLFDAFNRHDLEAVMHCFTPGAAFRAAAGPDADGRLFTGIDQIGAAFAAVWHDMPDARWAVHRSRVLGREAITEWLFTGIGSRGRIDAEGLDLFTFDGSLISAKSAFRKGSPSCRGLAGEPHGRPRSAQRPVSGAAALRSGLRPAP